MEGGGINVNVIWIFLSFLLIAVGIVYFLTSAKQYQNKHDEEQQLHMQNGKVIISIGVLGLFVIGVVNIAIFL